MTIEAFAPAKINLTLHVTGQRPDGYHLLDSLVVFADVGDNIHVETADELSLTLEGPQAADLEAERDNLVLRAARFLSPDRGAQITLTKRLPVASGIGGGSADAAASIRALAKLWDAPLPNAADTLPLGADVPACLESGSCRMSGIGDQLSHVPQLPKMDIVLVNPGVSVSTHEVFKALKRKKNSPMAAEIPRWRTLREFIGWLELQRNDLLEPATAIHPVIADTLNALRSTDCLFAGMSGSGATCFGLFPPDGHSAKAAAKAQLYLSHPNWWRAHGQVL